METGGKIILCQNVKNLKVIPVSLFFPQLMSCVYALSDPAHPQISSNINPGFGTVALHDYMLEERNILGSK